MEGGGADLTSYFVAKEKFKLRTLEERAVHLEAEAKELRLSNQLLDSQYHSQRETQADILKTLHANLDENFTKIEEQDVQIRSLEEKIQELQDEKAEELEKEKASWELKVQELTTRNSDLQDKLADVKEFMNRKEEIQQNLKDLEAQLAKNKEDHSKEISSLDRKKAIEIDQLKKDMMTRVKEVRDTLRAKTKDQLDTTTKRTIMENEQMATELQFQSRETEKLLDKNQALIEENQQLRRNLQIHKDLEDELARRTHVYQKLIRRLHQKLKDVASEESRDSLASESGANEGKGEARELYLGDLGAGGGGQQSDKLSKEMEGLQNTLNMVRYEFAQYRRDHATLTQLQDVSTRLVIAALYDLKNQYESGPFPPANYDENAPSNFAQMSPKQREYFFRMLLEKLNQSLCTTCCPAGPAQNASMQSSSSLPPIAGRSMPPIGADSANFTQFLQSITSNGQYGGAPHIDKENKAVQTSTDPADPCFKDGLWSPQSRSMHSQDSRITPAMVRGEVRGWGQRAMSVTSRTTRSIKNR